MEFSYFTFVWRCQGTMEELYLRKYLERHWKLPEFQEMSILCQQNAEGIRRVLILVLTGWLEALTRAWLDCSLIMLTYCNAMILNLGHLIRCLICWLLSSSHLDYVLYYPCMFRFSTSNNIFLHKCVCRIL